MKNPTEMGPLKFWSIGLAMAAIGGIVLGTSMFGALNVAIWYIEWLSKN